MWDTARLFTKDFSLKKENSFIQQEYFNDKGEIVKPSRRYCNINTVRINIKKIPNSTNDMLFITTELPRLISDAPLAEITQDDKKKLYDALETALTDSGVVLTNDGVENLRVSRVDFAKNIIVDNPIELYLNALSSCHSNRFKKCVYKDESISFQQSNNAFFIYNKVNQINETRGDLLSNHPENVLRLERRFFNASAVKRELGIAEPTLKDIFSEKLSRKILLDDFNRLTPSDTNVSHRASDRDKEIAAMLKSDQHKRNRGLTWMAYRHIEQLAKEFNYNWKSLEKYLVELRICERRQAARIVAELAAMYSHVNTADNDLFNEIRSKLADY